MIDQMAPAVPVRQRRAGLVLAVCCLAQLTVILDSSIVNVAIPSIQDALHFTPGSLTWVYNGYLIPFAGFLLLSGRMVDLLGGRRMLMVGFAVFTLFSLVGGIAPNAATLVIGRAGQGIGGAVMASASLAVLSSTFTEPVERAKALALWGAASGSGGAVGVLSGGAIVEWMSWRWVLLINVPLCLVIMAMAAVSVAPTPSRGTRKGTKLDLLGSLSVTLGIAALVYGLAEGQRYGWGSARIVTALTVGVVLLVVFVLDQAKWAAQPLMELSLFRNRSVWAANVTMLALGAALPTAFYFLTLLYQSVLHYSAMRTGLVFLPLTLCAFAGAAASSVVGPKVGPRPLMLVGLLPMIAGLLWQSAADENAAYAVDLLGPSLLFGLGLGILVTSVASAATAGVPDDKQGLASGVLNTSQALGGAAGLAVMVALAQMRTSQVADGGPPDAHAFASGYGVAFLATAVLLVCALAAAAAVPRTPPGSGKAG
ncbi:DHA2 family efflux MFS transporter permease subunit [Streptomyces nitrosporeus]|uniref:DHA2 family efflux MFS transporter permease subunit n=1 Tax=Streptomyces nitrosporeus TaxID=28894 RepID=A0A5J6FCW2_9ACTN|nr:MFS transporter [Streptomyces nitrosporeus]QEU73961.1 DHA2 family efflux MFS transporter permease subunit [Streptomyces nitrosporeus]GGZ00927.1 MFS transporter [Streptomyces nitrosporeus]